MANVDDVQQTQAPIAVPGGLEHGFSGERTRDVLTRFAVSLWFLVQAVNFVRDIAERLGVAGGLDLDALTASRLLSRTCLFFFFTLIAWLTLVRSRPVARAPGVQPRVSALLGTYLLYLLPFLPEQELGLGWSLVSSALILPRHVFPL